MKPVVSVVLAVAFADFVGFCYRGRKGFVKERPRFTDNPWRWSLRTGLYAYVVLAVALGRVWPHQSWLFYVLVGVGGATVVLLINRYWLGPYAVRKTAEPPPLT